MANQKPAHWTSPSRGQDAGGMLRRGFSWPIVEPTRICLSPRREQRASLDRRGGAGVVAGCEFVVEAESEKKLKKGGSPIFHQDTKTIVADHQQLKSAIGAAAISSTLSLSDHSLVFLLPASWNQVQPPSCWSGSTVSPPAAGNCIRVRKKGISSAPRK